MLLVIEPQSPESGLSKPLKNLKKRFLGNLWEMFLNLSNVCWESAITCLYINFSSFNFILCIYCMYNSKGHARQEL